MSKSGIGATTVEGNKSKKGHSSSVQRSIYDLDALSWNHRQIGKKKLPGDLDNNDISLLKDMVQDEL